jgi:hypothetical protein
VPKRALKTLNVIKFREMDDILDAVLLPAEDGEDDDSAQGDSATG